MMEYRPGDRRGGRPFPLGRFVLVVAVLSVVGWIIAAVYPEFRALRSIPFAAAIVYIVGRWLIQKSRPLPPQPLSPEEQAHREAETEAQVQRILRDEQHRDP